MAGIIRTTLATILPAIRTRLVEITGLNDERVGFCLDDRPPHWSQAEQIILIRPRGGSPDAAVFQGSGRVDARLTRRIRVNLWTRLARDEMGRDVEWLLDAVAGHLTHEARILDALWAFLPKDGDNQILSYPLEPKGILDPDKDKKDPNWGHSAYEFDVQFSHDLDQTYCTFE